MYASSQLLRAQLPSHGCSCTCGLRSWSRPAIARQSVARCQARSASEPDDPDPLPDRLGDLPVAKSSEELREQSSNAEALIRSLESRAASVLAQLVSSAGKAVATCKLKPAGCELSSQQGREPRTTNMVLGNDQSVDAWKELDKKVNKYPHRRTFKAIGEGGDNFKSCMQAAVEDVLGPVDPDRINHRTSSGKGAYISVSIGPVTVQNSQQVINVYSAMSQDSRLKYYL